MGGGRLAGHRSRRLLRAASDSDDPRRRADFGNRYSVPGTHDYRGRRRFCLVRLRTHLRDRGGRVVPDVLRSDRDDRDNRGEAGLLVPVRAMERRVVEQPIERRRDRGGPGSSDRDLLALRERGPGLLFRDRRGGDHRRVGPPRRGLSEATSAVRAPTPAAGAAASSATASVGIPTEGSTQGYAAPL